MGHLISNAPEINNLRFQAWPRRKVANVTVCRSGRLVMGLRKDGIIYCDRLSKHGAWVMNDEWWQSDIIECLVRLGVIDRSIQEQHMSIVKANDARRDARSLMEGTIPKLAKFGVKLTASQLKKLKRAAQ